MSWYVQENRWSIFSKNKPYQNMNKFTSQHLSSILLYRISRSKKFNHNYPLIRTTLSLLYLRIRNIPSSQSRLCTCRQERRFITNLWSWNPSKLIYKIIARNCCLHLWRYWYWLWDCWFGLLRDSLARGMCMLGKTRRWLCEYLLNKP